ncbi:hypothetical protein DFH07DRAFT_770728 [Mycena maculata]|uniref:Uncharacterized protein n=1 Tax=Mycena maculata TaxID=230809 RepID=A0AAD7JF11_9AGAR|nr:hypothetical protein DFH07DRAFT_770728 [Mycena maculata]
MEPFRTFCVAIIKAYANTVIGQQPHQLVAAAELQGVGCSTCSECAALKAFFLQDTPMIDFSGAQAKRSHIEQHLSATASWGVTWETHKLRSPHTLRVCLECSERTGAACGIGRWSDAAVGLGAGLRLDIGENGSPEKG